MRRSGNSSTPINGGNTISSSGTIRRRCTARGATIGKKSATCAAPPSLAPAPPPSRSAPPEASGPTNLIVGAGLCPARGRGRAPPLQDADLGGSMKVTGIETLSCDAGWRNYHFLKLTTDAGIVGWSEFDEGFGSPGVGAVIERLAERVKGQDGFDHERIYAELYCFTRPADGGVGGEGPGAIDK